MSNAGLNIHIMYGNIKIGENKGYKVEISNLYPDFRFEIHKLGRFNF